MLNKQVWTSIGLLLVLCMAGLAVGATRTEGREMGPLNEYDAYYDVAEPYGQIDVADITAVASHWNTTGTYSAPYWGLEGNAGTVPGTHFVGTTDGASLELRANGVGIGTSTPQSALHVVGNYVQIPARPGVPPAEDCNDNQEAGRVIGRTDAAPYVYICRGTDGWTGIGDPALVDLEAQNAALEARIAALEAALAVLQQ